MIVVGPGARLFIVERSAGVGKQVVAAGGIGGEASLRALSS